MLPDQTPESLLVSPSHTINGFVPASVKFLSSAAPFQP
jgi:hypothetical protein